MKSMMRYGAVMAVVFAAGLAGCAGHRRRSADRVIVDTKRVDLNAYYRDLDECQQYADDVRVGRRAAGGVVAGAVIGGAVGGAEGAGSGLRERDRVVKNCLAGRGYRVLN